MVNSLHSGKELGSQGKGPLVWATQPNASFLIEDSWDQLTKWESTPHWLTRDTSVNSFDLENVWIIGDFSSCAFSTSGKENRGGKSPGPISFMSCEAKE